SHGTHKRVGQAERSKGHSDKPCDGRLRTGAVRPAEMKMRAASLTENVTHRGEKCCGGRAQRTGATPFSAAIACAVTGCAGWPGWIQPGSLYRNAGSARRRLSVAGTCR